LRLNFEQGFPFGGADNFNAGLCEQIFRFIDF
jgi:hypothetical protein